MSGAEFARWLEFYNEQPFDDYHRYQRPAALVGHMASGRDMAPILAWLKREPAGAKLDEHEPEAVDNSGRTAADMATIRGLGLRPPPTRH